jgi:bromodomain and WD repeat domain-containing protein 1/3
MDNSIVLLEAHPIYDVVALSADENGSIILWNVEKGIPLKVFHERGYHLKLPNLEVPLLDGCFSPNGMNFVVSTDYGSFSIYGFGI